MTWKELAAMSDREWSRAVSEAVAQDGPFIEPPENGEELKIIKCLREADRRAAKIEMLKEAITMLDQHADFSNDWVESDEEVAALDDAANALRDEIAALESEE